MSNSLFARALVSTLAATAALLVACGGAVVVAPHGAVALANAPRCDSDPACPSGTSCHLTAVGRVCTTCAPGALPTCKDDRVVASCEADGQLQETDCLAQGKRCMNGTCVAQACKPGVVSCGSDGNIVRCNAHGSDAEIITRCKTAPKPVEASIEACHEEEGSPPVCSATCPKSQSGWVLRSFDCSPCNWTDVPFCGKESKEEGSCSSSLCQDGEIGFGVDPHQCLRETDGLVVPASEQRATCAGDGPIGTVTIAYQVCKDGKPTAASRAEPCTR